ncbi:hypothetical protein KY290_031972 [Solanum tuberosum]|uniref:Tf2-1-like SH3-like domain-containing protein n=1 Tax=Solanum tuberosum TaxID=4113 RepID=A0ABQ7UAS5_SOLTU|nr:hypothetical protein KY290_031972 [Solanum tuberosum]
MLRRDEVLSLLKFNLAKAQNRMKDSTDKWRTDDQFNESGWMFVKLQPYKQQSVRRSQQHKLSRKYFGPYKIIKRVGAVAYKLQLPVEARIHLFFHISLLKRCKGQPDQQITPLKLHDSATPNLEDKVLFLGRSNVVNPILDSEIVGPSDLVEDFGLESQLRRRKRVRQPNKLFEEYVWQPGGNTSVNS